MHQLLEHALGNNTQETKDKIAESIVTKLKNNPSEILNTLYFLRLNNSQPSVKLNLDLKNEKYKLNKFEQGLIKTIFAGNNKQTVFKKVKALEACLKEESLLLPLNEFLLGNPKELEAFLLEVYNFTSIIGIDSNIGNKQEYKDHLNSFNQSIIKEHKNTRKELEISDYAKILNAKKEGSKLSLFEDAIYSGNSKERIPFSEKKDFQEQKLEN